MPTLKALHLYCQLLELLSISKIEHIIHVNSCQRKLAFDQSASQLKDYISGVERCYHHNLFTKTKLSGVSSFTSFVLVSLSRLSPTPPPTLPAPSLCLATRPSLCLSWCWLGDWSGCRCWCQGPIVKNTPMVRTKVSWRQGYLPLFSLCL